MMSGISFSFLGSYLRDRLPIVFLTVVLIMSVSRTSAETWYVNNISGGDNKTGLTEQEAFGTLAQGVSRLKPGDRLVIMNSGQPYRESLVLHDISGTKEKPIEIDGGGSVLDGSVSIAPDSWTALGNDLYSRPLKLGQSVRLRFFLLFDGKINRMGNVLKAYLPFAFKPADQLKANEWTWIESEKKLYVRLPKGTSLKDANLAMPDITRWESGVKMFGTCRYIVIRNLTATHFYNDGYNIHGNCSEIGFYNVRALYNGDDGISAHESCSFILDGFYSEGCGTGICHINKATGIHKNAILKNNAGIEIALFNETSNVLENISVESTALLGVIVDCRSCIIKNVKIRYIGEKKKTRIQTKELIQGKFEIINGVDSDPIQK